MTLLSITVSPVVGARFTLFVIATHRAAPNEPFFLTGINAYDAPLMDLGLTSVAAIEKPPVTALIPSKWVTIEGSIVERIRPEIAELIGCRSCSLR